MYSDYKGIVDLVCKDGSSMILENVIFVPNLGTNLLSARRLCDIGLVGCFDSDTMYFKCNEKIFIKAKMINGLYIVKHDSKVLKENAFSSVDHDMNSPPEQDGTLNGLLTPKNQNNSFSHFLTAPSNSDTDRYFLFHRRFAHLGPKKISKLHTVTTLEKPIKVPKELRICEVCAISKMKNSISKVLADHIASKIALVQLDIAGPFPESLQGNRYFLLIVDSFTHKNWVLVLKAKSDAKNALEEWKKIFELQANTKISAARSDNAPELV